MRFRKNWNFYLQLHLFWSLPRNKTWAVNRQVTIWASSEGAFFNPIIMVDLLVDYSGDLLRFRIDQIWVITTTGDTSYQALIINMREQYSSVQLWGVEIMWVERRVEWKTVTNSTVGTWQGWDLGLSCTAGLVSPDLRHHQHEEDTADCPGNYTPVADWGIFRVERGFMWSEERGMMRM